MTDKDDATIEEARKRYEIATRHGQGYVLSVTPSDWLALIDIATRRGERIKELERQEGDWHFVLVERDALAEENKSLRDQLLKVQDYAKEQREAGGGE